MGSTISPEYAAVVDILESEKILMVLISFFLYEFFPVIGVPSSSLSVCEIRLIGSDRVPNKGNRILTSSH